MPTFCVYNLSTFRRSAICTSAKGRSNVMSVSKLQGMHVSRNILGVRFHLEISRHRGMKSGVVYVGSQRAVLNFTPGPQARTSPLGVYLAPRGLICPLEECSPLRSPLGVNTLYCLDEWRGEHRILPPGDNITPRGQSSTLGSKFVPRCEVKSAALHDFVFNSCIG
jgi:hypothetical protein